MIIHYYKVETPGEAFEAASKDASKWSDAELKALADMARTFRRGFNPTQRSGSGLVCLCNSGYFLLFDDKPDRGYGISLVQLREHEAGVADPVAQEILDFHRVRRGQALFADQLLVFSEAVSTLRDLDRGYALLEEARLIGRAGNIVTVKDADGQEHQRPAFICR